MDLDHARLPLHSDERVTNSKFIFVLLLPFTLSWRFWWGNGVKGPKLIPFWCLMQKGEKIRPKQEMDQLPLENFEKVELEFLFVKILLFVSYCQKLVSCGENIWLWEIGRVFVTVINFYWNNSLYVSTSGFDLEIGIWVWFAKTNQVVAKSDPYMPKMNQNNFEFSFVLMLHFL